MSDTGPHDQDDGTQPEQPTRNRPDGDGDGVENPVTDESPAGDASEAADEFAREEGEAPSG